MKKRKKWLWIPITALVLTAAVAGVLIFKPGQSKEPVYVYRVGDGMIGMTDYYEGGSESYGTVTTDRVQPVYLTNTQTVLSVPVAEGQQVKKGDTLFTYDTTLTQLQLQRKDLSIQQMKINLNTAKEELKAIKKYKPIYYHPTKPTPPPTTKPSTDTIPDLGDLTDVNYRIYSGTGNSRTAPKYCWLRSGALVDESVMEDLFSGVKADEVYVVFQNTRNNSAAGKITNEYGLLITRVAQEVPTEPTVPPTEPPTAPTDPPTEPPTDPTTEPSTDPSTEPPTDPSIDPTAETEPQDPPPPETTEAEPTAVVLAAQSGELPYAYQIGFFNPPSADEVVKPSPPAGDNVDWNSGFTSTEIAAMRKEKEAEISQLTFDIKMAEAEYKIMQKEADSGKITAEFDGVVVGILDPEEARQTNQPLMRVSGGGGYYIEGTVSELELATIQVGQEVEVTSYENWETVIGTISEIGRYPADSGYTYYGDSNMSYYPYKVFIDESANLQDGYYVSLRLQQSAQQESGLYLSSAFVLSEADGNFVYLRNEDGLLEKRQVQTGKSLWGSYIQIRGGITAEDCLAFPYGREVREGAPTADGDADTLYGY